MFKPLTRRISDIAAGEPERIRELENIFSGPTNVYIDYANVRPWSRKLGWNVDLRRLAQLLKSFDAIRAKNIYYGTLAGDPASEQLLEDLPKFGYQVKTKPVKRMRIPINVSSISSTSSDILKSFVRGALLQKLRVEDVEYLNSCLKRLNEQGVFFIQDLKCNFDVEIGRDMLIDFERNKTSTYILWSGDSDFADPIQQLLSDGKRVVIFATARRISRELDQLKKEGMEVFDIQKIKNFICWKREMDSKEGPGGPSSGKMSDHF